MNKAIALSFTALLGFATLPSFADELAMPDKSAVHSVSVPERGMNMEQVEAVFGAPESKNGPKGTPPIYYWEYATFTVYFESNFVIHSVMKYRPAKN